jgi:hypothetical protein
MLQISRVDPSKSSFKVFNRSHGYNANPSAPLRYKVRMHVIPSKRRTWEVHTKAGYCLGNSWEHYRYHKIWIVDTRSVRVGQTIFFKHKYLTQPSVTPQDAIVGASDNLCGVLRGKPSAKNEVRTDVDMLMEVFKNVSGRCSQSFDKCIYLY